MVCPKCGMETDNPKNFCEQCGFDFREIKVQENLLETDPVLVSMNNQYARYGIVRLVAGLAALVFLFLIYQWLENNIPERLGDIGLLLFLPALIVFIVFSVLRGSMRKKIQRELTNRTQGNTYKNNV